MITNIFEIACGVILAKIIIGVVNESYWYKWQRIRLELKRLCVAANDTRKRSKYHVRARNLLKEMYHSYRILEEVKLPGSTLSHRKGVLFLDFLIPQISLAVEVHGQQHYEYTPSSIRIRQTLLGKSQG